MNNARSSRRALLIKAGQAVVAASLPISQINGAISRKKKKHTFSGTINHSVCSWTYGFLTLSELCVVAQQLGILAIDLVAPKDFTILKEHQINCSMCYTGGKVSLTQGWNNTANHPWLIKDYQEAIPIITKAGYKNLICFSGNRDGMDNDTGLTNCIKGLQQIMPLAEKHGITIQMELFNSKVDHKDYMADSSAWAIELCKRLGSNNFKLLYDIYHMQISEGDIIRTIQENHAYFGHYHTAGVPGRHEIDETQELYYPAIMQAIAATGYTGYVAQEFIPTGKTKEEKIAALQKAIKICTI
jgi:hydroxypyruvate isomerase